jgi:hypothetical protein
LPESFETFKDENPFSFSLVISLLAATISLFISVLFLDNAIAWVGYVIHVIFAAPWFIVYWVGWVLFWLLGALWSVLVWFGTWLFTLPWGMLGYVFGMGLLCLLSIAVTFWVLYRIGVFLFNRGAFNFLIKKSCNVRESRQEKKFARLAERRKKEAAEKKKKDEHYKAHKKEIDAKRKKREETVDKWFKTLGTIFTPVIWLINGLFSVIGTVCVAIWWAIKKVGEFFYVLWHMLTSTVSNHCPPIEFIQLHEDVGELVPNRHNGGYLDGEKRKLHIDADKFPEKFRLKTKQEDYKKVRISYNLVASELCDYDDHYHVHSINAIKYLPKPRKSRAKKVKEDGK